MKRISFFDKDGSTCWSEAPAEGIFSILAHIVEHRPSLTPRHLAKISRIVKEGPAPGTKKAEALTKKALRRWPSQHGRRFTTNSFMHGITSSTVTAALDKDN